MWRYKYLVPGMLEQKPIIRWLGGVNRMAFGNAIDIIECNSSGEASAAAQKLANMTYRNKTNDLVFKPISLSGSNPTWECPQATDETMESTWNIIVTSSGPYLFLSSLPPEGTSAVIAAVGQGTH